MPHFEIQMPGKPSYNHELRDGETTVGRDQKNMLVIEDLRVSRQHAIIKNSPDGVTFRDLGSGNGTIVNGQPLSARFDRKLVNGDVIKLGSCSLTLKLGDGEKKPAAHEDSEFRQVLQLTPDDMIGNSTPGIITSQEVSPLLLRRELEKREQLLRLFYQLGEKLSSIFSLPQIYSQVFEILMQATPASRCFIFRKTDQGDFEQVQAHFREEGDNRDPLPISKTIFEKVARERVSILLSDSQHDQPLTSQSIIAHQIRSIMAAPISGPRGLLGIIYADRFDLLDTFQAQDLDTLNAVAVQTGIAINAAINHERLQKQAQARDRFERFLPRQVIDEILRSPEKVKLGGIRQPVTALFADVRGFTTLSESSSPELIVNLLNRYFTIVSEIIFRNTGTLDKYIGDGLMALFGAPYISALDTVNAVRAAIEMQRAMVGFNQQLANDKLPPISIGIGINAGQAIVGYIGSESRLDYTAIGDTINTAARLESKAQPGQIVISENAAQILDESFRINPIGTQALKGKLTSIRLYDVLWD
jgi:adenylate cyclase